MLNGFRHFSSNWYENQNEDQNEKKDKPILSTRQQVWEEIQKLQKLIPYPAKRITQLCHLFNALEE